MLVCKQFRAAGSSDGDASTMEQGNNLSRLSHVWRSHRFACDTAQVAQLAGDNRLGVIALLFVPVVGWVGFNILGPLLNQLDAMSGEGAKAPKKKGK